MLWYNGKNPGTMAAVVSFEECQLKDKANTKRLNSCKMQPGLSSQHPVMLVIHVLIKILQIIFVPFFLYPDIDAVLIYFKSN
jgi:hypothetical protein